MALLISSLCLSSTVFADEFDFSYTNKEHMRGAFMMCATQGFFTPHCQKVLNLCWLPPMLTLKCAGFFCSISSECLEAPSFSMNADDVRRANEAAKKRLQEQGVLPSPPPQHPKP